MRCSRKYVILSVVLWVTTILILGALRIAFMGRVRAHYSFVDPAREYTVLVRERSNEAGPLDWVFTLAGFAGLHHPGRYSYRADLYEGHKRIATTGWSEGDTYYEPHVSVLAADRARVEISYGGGDYNTDESNWRPL